MTITTYTGGVVQTNGFVVNAPGGTIVIDAPGGMAGFLRSHGLRPDALLLTHQHFDHVEDAAELARMGAVIHGHSPFSHDLILDAVARRWGLPVEIEDFEVTTEITPGDPLVPAGVEFEVMHLPGHSPDSLGFHLSGEGVLFGGDTLFAGSIGRTDFPGGDQGLLLRGIRERLLPLPDSTILHPGHGPSTTIGQEAATNPFLA